MLTRPVAEDGLLRLQRPQGLDAALAMVSSIGQPDFARSSLEQLKRFAPVSWWTVYRLHEDREPDWHLGASATANDVVPRAWACYRAGLWRRDETFACARGTSAGHGVLFTHLHAAELQPAHRRQIYSAFGLAERVSLVRRQADDSVLCVNFYTGERMPPFSESAMDDLACVGELVIRAVESHVRCPGVVISSPLVDLPRREREVCDRLLRGLTYDGIATDLGLSANTVKTYRDRAFHRLGIHHRNELFALMLDASSMTAGQPQSKLQRIHRRE